MLDLYSTHHFYASFATFGTEKHYRLRLIVTLTSDYGRWAFQESPHLRLLFPKY